MNRFFFTIIAILCNLGIGCAQDVIITPFFSGDGKAVKTNNGYHALAGVTSTFTVEFTHPNNDDHVRNYTVESLTCTFNGKDLTYNAISENTWEIVFTPEILLNGKLDVMLTYSYEQGHDEPDVDGKESPNNKVWVPVHNQKVLKSSENISIYEIPIWISSYKKTYEQSNRQLFVDGYEKGNESGWRFKWDNNGETTTSSYTVVKPKSSLPDVKTTNLTVRNYAPDGTTLWFEENISIDTYFYDKPIVSVASSSATETNFYKSTGDNAWILSATGGEPSGWSISWNGGETSGSGFTYMPFMSEVSENILGKKITATIRNEVDGHLLLPETTIEVATINIYKALTHEKGSVNQSVYSGEQVSFSLGNVDEIDVAHWEYSWTNGKKNTKQITIAPTETQQHTVSARLLYDGKQWDYFTETYTATVYTHPSATTAEIVEAKDVDGNSVTPIQMKDVQYGAPSTHVQGQIYHMLAGDVINIGLNCMGGDSDSWDYVIYLNGNEVKRNEPYTFSPVVSGKYTIKIDMTNGRSVVNNPFTGSITREYEVYEKPNMDILERTIHIHAGYKGEIHPSLPEEEQDWELESTGKTLTIPTFVAQKETIPYSYFVLYRCEGSVRYKKDYIINLEVWPQPKVSALTLKLRDKDINEKKDIIYYDVTSGYGKPIVIDCFDGDVVDIAYTIEGGYANDNITSWTYENSLRSRVNIPYSYISNAKGNSNDEVTATTTGTEAFAEKTFSLHFTNMPDPNIVTPNPIWLDEKYDVTIRAWRTPQIYDNATDSVAVSSYYITNSWKNGDRVDIYGGPYAQNNANYNLSHANGYTEDGGWEYKWTDEKGTTLSTVDTKWSYTPETSDAYTDKDFTVYIANRIGANYALRDTIIYKARVWRKAEFATELSMNDEYCTDSYVDNIFNIRAGNVLDIAVVSTKYGYPDGCMYDWSNTSSSVSTLPTDTTKHWQWTATANSSSKDYKYIHIVCQPYVLGPYGNIWDMQSEISHEVCIFNRPESPVSLYRKGNGTSGTMICSTSVSDNDLEGKQYYLTFGYTDVYGNSHDLDRQEQKAKGEVRWSPSFPASVMKDSNNKFYVYATWLYGDSGDTSTPVAAVTSGKRYVGYCDEQWDGSTYGARKVTRAGYPVSFVTNGIEELHNAKDIYSSTARYNLSGQRISNNVKGFVISNGKKYYIK